MRFVNIVVILLILIVLTGCSKHEKLNEPLGEYKEGTILSESLSRRQIIDAETFAKEMRDKGVTVKVKDLNMPNEINFIMREKNITPDTKICFDNSDCEEGTKCITQCRFDWEGDVWNGRVFFCNIDEFKDYEHMKFMVDFGFCLDKTKWHH